MQDNYSTGDRSWGRVASLVYGVIVLVVCVSLGRYLTYGILRLTSLDLYPHAYRGLGTLLNMGIYVALVAAPFYLGPTLGAPHSRFSIRPKLGSPTERTPMLRWCVLVGMASVALAIMPDILVSILGIPARKNSALIELFDSPWDMGVIIVAIGISPFVEELVARGLVLSRLLHAYPTWLAVTISAALWTVGHQGNWGLIFLTGMLFAIATIRVGSLIPSMVGHAIFNLTSMLLVNMT